MVLPYHLRLADFELAMQDVYDFFHDVNGLLLDRGLHRLDDMLRPARDCEAPVYVRQQSSARNV